MVRKRSAVESQKDATEAKVKELFGPDDLDAARPPLPEADGKLFETASDGRPKFPPMPNLGGGFQELVRDLFAEGVDVMAEYEAIKDSLAIDGPLTPVAVQEAANQTEKMALRGYRLYVMARVEYSAYVRETDVIVAAMRDSAVAKLEQEKAQKLRTKQITEGDVGAMIAQLHPDEWADVNLRKERAEKMVNYVEQLQALAKSRCFSVARMQRREDF